MSFKLPFLFWLFFKPSFLFISSGRIGRSGHEPELQTSLFTDVCNFELSGLDLPLNGL